MYKKNQRAKIMHVSNFAGQLLLSLRLSVIYYRYCKFLASMIHSAITITSDLKFINQQHSELNILCQIHTRSCYTLCSLFSVDRGDIISRKRGIVILHTFIVAVRYRVHSYIITCRYLGALRHSSFYDSVRL